MLAQLMTAFPFESLLTSCNNHFPLAFPALSQAIPTAHTFHCFWFLSPKPGSIHQPRAESQFSYNILCIYIFPVYTYIVNTGIHAHICDCMYVFTLTIWKLTALFKLYSSFRCTAITQTSYIQQIG